MEQIGQARRALVAAGASLLHAACALGVAALISAIAWPFAIDDAFIGVRYARHLVSGAGYVWNVGGPSTDGVTPLPWAFLLVPLAHASPLAVLGRVKLAGALVWTGAAGLWGGAVGRTKAPPWVKLAAVLFLLLNVSVAAHSVSGMETSFAMSLATIAAIAYRRPYVAATLAGLAATLRPELVVWSAVLAAGYAMHGDSERRRRRATLAVGLAVLPFAACAVVRALVFGRPAPLSVLAKPSDLAHGLAYAGAAAVFTLAPIVLAAPFALARERGPALVLALAGLAHFVVIALVGGDWMPYARLAAPIVPSLLFAFVVVAPFASAKAHAARAFVALSFGVWFFSNNVGALRRAGQERAEMIEAARPLLASARNVAAVDIGWVSAVHDGPIVDLAGVTDPEVAALGGGHTSKRIDAAFLLARDPDTAVFYADPLPERLDDVAASSFPRVVEARLAGAPLFAEHFAPVALLPLGRRAGYVIYSRR